MRYCGHFLIKVEGGAKNYKCDYPLPLAWRSFTVEFVQRKGYTYMWPYVKLYAHARWYVMGEGLSFNHFLKHGNHFMNTENDLKCSFCYC